MAYKDKQQMYDYNNAFQKATYDRIQVLAPKDTGQQIRQAAADAGESVSGYILEAVHQRMEREGA